MTGYSHAGIVPTRWPWVFILIGRQLLLVPEALFLLLLLCWHMGPGIPPVSTLPGLGLIGWFVSRFILIILARRAFDQACYPRAARLIRVALWLYPFSADARALRGTIALAQGDAEAAVAELHQAIILYPGHAMLHATCGSALLEAGKPVEACWEAIHAMALDPTCAPAYLHLANAGQVLGAPIEQIEAHLRQGLQAAPAPVDEAALRCTLAALLVEEGRPVEAQLTLVGIEALLLHGSAPQQAGLHYYLGELRRAIGDSEAAHSHFSTSETLDPHGRFAAAAWRGARL
jgi:tetratricopeptide (TPR) repeat protein